MKRNFTSFAVGAASLLVSIAAFAGDSGRGNAVNEPSGMRGQSSMQAPPVMTQSAPATRPSAAIRPAAPTAVTAPTTTHETGQPGVECGEEGALNTPGNASSAPGSAFNEDGKAGTVYAGEQPQNSRNPASVSQYDAACAHQR